MTKQIIGRGHEFGGLYIYDSAVLRPIACSGGYYTIWDSLQIGPPLSSTTKEIVSLVFKLVILRL